MNVTVPAAVGVPETVMTPVLLPEIVRPVEFVIPESAYTGPVGGWWAVRAVVDEGGIVPAEVI